MSVARLSKARATTWCSRSVGVAVAAISRSTTRISRSSCARSGRSERRPRSRPGRYRPPARQLNQTPKRQRLKPLLVQQVQLDDRLAQGHLMVEMVPRGRLKLLLADHPLLNQTLPQPLVDNLALRIVRWPRLVRGQIREPLKRQRVQPRIRDQIQLQHRVGQPDPLLLRMLPGRLKRPPR